MIRAAVIACVLLTASSCDRRCDGDEECDVGFACPVVADECARTCTLRPVRGETCSVASADDVCQDFALSCDDGLICASRADVGTCVPLEGRVINETCSVDDECEANLVCATAGDADAGECAPATGRGTDVPCDDDAQCASGTCSTGACA